MRILQMLLVILLFSAKAWAFPQLVRHGYAQCTACHVSPSGSGMLTPYGRQLSAELLSTWSKPNEVEFLHSEFAGKWAEKGYLFGGDIRSIQTHVENENEVNGKLFVMQANLDMAVQKNGFTALVSVGQIENPLAENVKGNFNATKFYLLWQTTDFLGFRVGRFTPNFGLNVPDHIMIIKSGLGFQPQLQYDTLEASYLSENWSFFAGTSERVETKQAPNSERALTATVAYNFYERFKTGVSYWQGNSDVSADRNIVSLFGILGFSAKFYNMSEVDLQRSKDDTIRRLALSQWGYELTKGFTPYFQYQVDEREDSTSLKRTHHYGLGFNFFPRPHFELSSLWDRIQGVTGWSDSAYLLVHYYF